MTMTRSTFLISLFIALFASLCGAFSPAASRSVTRATFVPPAVPLATRAIQNPWSLRMSDEEKSKGDGTFYDDEREPEVKKEGISDSMKAKLMAEASTGLDSNQKQTNVLLYIILGVAVLVILGGQGIFF